MHFTRAAIATAILATASSAAPAPAGTGATVTGYSNSTTMTDCSSSATMTKQSVGASTAKYPVTTVTTSYIPIGTGTGTGTGYTYNVTNTAGYYSSMTYGSGSPSATVTNTAGYYSSMTYSSGSPSATQQPNNGNGNNGNAGKNYIELSKTQQLFLADTVADRFDILNKDEDFIFNFNVPQLNAGKGGSLIAANRKSFPALVGTGAGMAVGTINGCGINTFHVHPRSAELQIVTEGRIVTEMALENGVLELDPKTGKMVRRVIKTTLTPYMMTPFYQGSMHTQYNPDCTPAKFIAAFASEDFGTAQSAESLFSMDPDLVATVLGNGEVIDGADVEKVRGLIPASIAQGVEACLAKCGIQKRAL